METKTLCGIELKPGMIIETTDGDTLVVFPTKSELAVMAYNRSIWTATMPNDARVKRILTPTPNGSLTGGECLYLKSEFKDGDILYNPINDVFIIYKDTDKEGFIRKYAFLGKTYSNFYLKTGVGRLQDTNYRKPNDEEMFEFHKRMQKERYFWNENTKKLHKIITKEDIVEKFGTVDFIVQL